MEEEIKIKKPNRKVPIIIVSVIAAVVLLLIIIAIALPGGNKSIPSGKIGDSLVNSDGVTFRVDNAEDVKRLGDTYLYETTPNNFILITLTIKNTTKETITIYGTCVDLYNEAGTKLEEHTSLYINYILYKDLNPGTSLTFQVAYETNTTTKEEKYVAKIGYSYLTSNSDRVKVTLEK